MSTCLSWGLNDEEEDYVHESQSAQNRSVQLAGT